MIEVKPDAALLELGNETLASVCLLRGLQHENRADQTYRLVRRMRIRKRTIRGSCGFGRLRLHRG
jgi:hypothetical protein